MTPLQLSILPISPEIAIEVEQIKIGSSILRFNIDNIIMSNDDKYIGNIKRELESIKNHYSKYNLRAKLTEVTVEHVISTRNTRIKYKF